MDRGILTLLAFATAGQIASAIFLPSMPVIAEALAVSPASIQRLSSYYLVIYAIAHLLGGFLCDRFGRKRIITWGIVLAVLGGLITIKGNLDALYLGRIFQAFGFGLAAIATKAVMRDRYSGRDYAVAISYFLNVALLAPAVAPLLGAWIAASFGWLVQFFVVAAMTLVVGAAVFPFDNSTNENKKSDEGSLAALLFVIRDVKCMGLSFVSGMVYASDIAIEIMMPFFLKDRYGAGTGASALFFAFSLIFILIGSSIIRFIKHDIEVVVRYGAFLMILSTLILLAFESAILIIGALGFYLLACGMLYSTLSAIALLPHKSSAGMAASISGAIHMGIAGLGSTFATWLSPDLTSLRLMLLGIAISVMFLNIVFVGTGSDKAIGTENL